jgi:hypothetical protein
METILSINSSYRCKRSVAHHSIQVLNSGGYVLASYIEPTGEVKWQRVIPATDKKVIEDWLVRNFPSNGS